MNEREIIEGRANTIVKEYNRKRNRQIDVAEHYDIPVNLVRKVVRAYGFDYGKEVTEDNRTDRQKVKPCVNYDELKELLKYDIPIDENDGK